jgi:hypothetical protein
MIQRQVKRREDCWVDPARATSYPIFALSFGISPNLGSQKTRIYPGLADALQAIACVSADGKGTPEVHGKTDLSKHMLFQSVRLVGEVGIEKTTLSWNRLILQ